MNISSKRKSILFDVMIVVIMGCLLYYGASWQIFKWFTDAGKYQCYAVAFWRGTPALKLLAVPRIQCSFITNPRSDAVFITESTLLHLMSVHKFPSFLISFVASQSPSQPLHSLPYEYPLLTVLPFTLGLVAPAYWYQVAFALGMAVLVAVLYFIIKSCKSQKAAFAFALYMVVGCWATALARFDIIPAGLTLVALLCTERRKWKWAYALLALATMFKFYPLVLLPAFLIAQQKLMRKRWYAPERWSGLGVFAAVCAALTVFSLLLSVVGTLNPLGYFGDRPVQVESASASVVWLASFLGYHVHYVATYGSLNVVSPVSSVVSLGATVLLVAGLGYLFWLQWRERVPLAVSILLILLIVMFTGKVFSPQYLIWIVPFAAYIGETNWKWLMSWVGIGGLTTWIFPYIYSETKVFIRVATLPTFNPVVLARNTLLLVFIVTLLVYYTRNRAGTQIPSDAIEPVEQPVVVSVPQHD